MDPEWRERNRMSDDGKEEAAQFSDGQKVAEGRNGRRSDPKASYRVAPLLGKVILTSNSRCWPRSQDRITASKLQIWSHHKLVRESDASC